MDRWAGGLSRCEGETGLGQSLACRPDPRLSAHVLGYAGSHYSGARTVVRRIAPIDGIKLIIDFENLDRRMLAANGAGAHREPPSPVVGLRTGPLVFEQTGTDHGMVVGLTPLGAHALLGLPLRELPAYAGFAELLGPRAARLVDELAHAPTWSARFALLDRRLLGWLDPDRRLASPVQAAWDLLNATHGRLTVAGLADRVGWSRSHFEARFRTQIGITPKAVARIARFHHALRLLCRPDPPRAAEIASVCGYADQPHLNREFRAFTGCSPTRFLSLPDQET
ncbi:helix-turn-helix domain-containing protein [Amycolatopsis dendrobii]|uniref:Helix-turn-helix transcriptional regulator n=1 Tax=Amycolatopsis dendrobii TaxID=2760662 RepID=A0A7W3Z8Q7_9PSEU|nr:AraC family transcriptional regulator [Amycolatopsis dendrobii]MBB1151723.1 helix-turn-helix transcriptional regulator [Amycolatopsis dendrobii]